MLYFPSVSLALKLLFNSSVRGQGHSLTGLKLLMASVTGHSKQLLLKKIFLILAAILGEKFKKKKFMEIVKFSTNFSTLT